MFQAVNRPHDQISFGQMVDGLVAFRRNSRAPTGCKSWSSVDTRQPWRRSASWPLCVDRIQPDRVQLNTVTRASRRVRKYVDECPPRRGHAGAGPAATPSVKRSSPRLRERLQARPRIRSTTRCSPGMTRFQPGLFALAGSA